MQSSGTTDDLEPSDGRQGSEQPTQALGADSAPTLTGMAAVSSSRDRCGACGATLAPDQRYCVECGQRRGSSRVEMMQGVAPRAEVVKETSVERKLPRLSANAALIAAVGTLLLAMGVGVLIGRWATSEKSGGTPVKVITVGGGTGTGTTPTTTGSEATSETGTSNSGSGSSTATKGASSKSKTTKSTPTGKKPKAKVVKLGSKGSGAGYNKKKEFTGEFFGEEEK